MFDVEGIKAVGDNINGVASTAFTLDSATGVLRLNFEVLATMKGYFEFKILAYDLGKFRCFVLESAKHYSTHILDVLILFQSIGQLNHICLSPSILLSTS